MWLQNGDHRVLVTAQGGSVLQWQYRGKYILGPSRAEDVGGQLKVRGETHWCFPNFGKDSRGVYPQHGFFRETVLQPAKGSPHSAHFWAGVSRDRFVILDAGVTVTPSGLTMSFYASNMGTERFPVLLGLHPYFAMQPAGLIRTHMGNQVIAVAKKFDTDPGTFGPESRTIQRTGRVAVEIAGLGRVEMDLPDACSHLVLWSDQPDKYACVEPIFGTPGTFGTEAGNWLYPSIPSHFEIGMRFVPE